MDHRERFADRDDDVGVTVPVGVPCEEAYPLHEEASWNQAAA